MSSRSTKDERKLQQLCRQVERRLSMVFAGEMEDQLLEGLWVVAVTAPFGGSVLEVEVGLPAESSPRDHILLLSRLEAASGWLRSEVATAINRKRTPRLVFTLHDD